MESDIMRDVKSMSYLELKKYAKELGIEIEDVKKIKKEGLIEKIKAHFEQKVIESAKEVVIENEEKPKTRKKKVLKKQAAIDEPVEEPIEEPAPVKKSSRRKEKSTEQVEQPIEEKAKAVKKKTKKISTTETVEEPVPVPETTPIKEKKTKKVTKKTSKRSKDEVVEDVQPQVEPVVVEQPEEVEIHSSAKAAKKVRKVKKTTKSTPTKKTKKTKSTRGAVVEPVVEHSPESRNEPLVLTNSPEPAIQLQEASKTQEIIAQQQAPVTPRPSRQSVSKLSESAKQILSKSASKTTTKPTRSSARLSKSFNASLLTDDDEDRHEEANITNDVQNATFDKPSTSSQPVTEQLKPSLLASVMNSAKKVLACSSFYLSSATNNSPFKIPPIANEPVKIASPTLEPPKDKIVAPVVEPVSEASQVQPQSSVDPANQVKKTGGARIVKPTQTVLIKTTIVKENNVVVEQLREEKVEAVRREAGGPRIVKPVEEKIDTKKTKIPDVAGDRAKKIKSSTETGTIPSSKSTNDIAKKTTVKPVPDFKTLHSKEANKFESIDAWADRVQQRHTNIGDAMKKKLTPAKKQPEGKPVPTVVVSAPPAELTSNKETKIPLVNKKPAVAQPIKLPNSTSTPNFNESTLPNKIDMGQAPFMSTPNNRDPATPKLTGPKNDAKLTLSTVKKQPQQQPKTPGSAARPKPQFNQLLKAAVTNNASQQSGNVETNKPVLQAPPTGSFQRRKSFDLTASLSKPLKYKQYTGKLKPVDFNAKNLFLNNLAQAGGGDKTMVKMNTTQSVKPAANTSSMNVLKSITNDNTAKVGGLTSATPSKKPVVGSIVKSSLSGLRTDKTEIAGMAKAEKLSTNLDKSRSLIKKAKAEQISQSRQHQIDSTRNIENQATKS